MKIKGGPEIIVIDRHAVVNGLNNCHACCKKRYRIRALNDFPFSRCA